MTRTSPVSISIIALLLTASGQAQAGSSSEFYGSFQEQYPIAVPAFHGVEPALSLNYDSGGDNGFTGVGWSLSGFSTIERASPGRGAPRYDGNDVYLLDGQELVAYTGLGGTHATKVQSYVRIQKDVPAPGQWTVTQKNGTRAVYAPVYGVTGGTFRWGLTNVIDTSNNTVSYGWWCDPSADCYPSTVTYNGVSITLYREARPDPISFTNGEYLGRTSYRLKSVDVRVSGSRARAYKLTYGTSGSTGRSLLASVQQYGRDAIVDGSGTVSGGTALPATGIGYRTSSVGVYGNSQPSYPGWNFGDGNSYRALTGDFNGDGKTDIDRLGATGHHLMISNGNGTFASSGVSYGGWNFGDGGSYREVPGDFNGDGKTDIDRLGATGHHLMISNGDGTFTNYAVSYGGWNFGDGAQYREVAGDFNGDGKTDVDRLGATGHHLMISNGDGTFTNYAVSYGGWNFGDGASYRELSGDFDGDGKTDVDRLGATGHHLMLSNGNGTFTNYAVSYGGWNFGDGNSYRAVTGDFNGDGKTDVDRLGATGHHLMLSNGNGTFTNSAVSYGGWGFGDGNSYREVVDDFNGDGKTDVDRLGPTGHHLMISNGDGTFTNYAVSYGGWGFGDGNSYRELSGDFNGDGKADVDRLGPTCHHLMINSGGVPDLLVSVANGLGGTTSVTYAPSSAWANSNNPPVVQTVTQLGQTDGRGWSSTTGHSYAGGLYDQIERRFLGFHYARATLPCIPGEAACPYQETWFRQDYGSVSKPERVDNRDGNGRLLSSTTTTFTTNGGTVPYTSLETMTWAHAYDGSGTTCSTWPCAYGRRSAVSRTWDGYANVVIEVAYGDYDLGGDEKTVRTTYRPNASSYVVGLPAALDTFHGTSTAGTLLAQSATCYDGSAAENQPCWDRAPGRGKPTQSCAWLDTNSSFVCTRSEYDGWGNVIAEVEPLGARTTYTIDSTYHLLVVQKANPLGQGMSNQYDSVCGVVTSATDANGQVAVSTYDALCRPTRTDKPGGGYVRVSYVSTGDPNAQHLLEERGPPPAGVSGELWTRSYTDGLGRTYKVVARGPVAGKDIIQEQFFNPRGNSARTCTPYFTGEAGTSVCTVPSYDADDRVIRFTLPDGRIGTMTYGLGTNLAVDPDGRQVKSVYDTAGNLVERHELLGGTWAITRSEYDVRGNPTRILDAAGNALTVVYDSLGRRTSVTDANAGTRTMIHDAAGRLLSVTDGAGQRVEHGYDALGRPVSKVARRANGTVERTVTYAYDQARSGAFNVGMLTTVTDPSGPTTHDYDAAGNLVAKTRTIDGVAYTTRWKYDAAGRLLGTRYADGDVVGDDPTTAPVEPPLTYNPAGTLAAIPQVVTALTYDAAGRVTRQDNANGTVDTSSYDFYRGWLNALGTTRGTSTLQSLTYRRSAAGQITRIESPFANEAWDYQYDTLGRLTGAWIVQQTTTTSTSCQTVCDDTPNQAMALPGGGGGSCHEECTTTTTTAWTRPGSSYDQTWAYNAIGNMTSSSRLGAYAYSSGRPHAVTQAGANAYAYDGNGNLTAGAGRSLSWTVEDRVAQVTAGGTTYAYTYDGAGFRIKKVGNGQTTITPEADYEVAGGVVTKYLSLPLGKHKRVGAAKYWLHLDHQGSVRVITDVAGTEVQRRKYGSYGDILSSSTGHAESRGFTGQRADETGLIYLDARYYDPVLGRFLSPDPMAAPSAAHLNRYAYAGNDPVNNVDPDGLFFKALGKFFKKIGKAIAKGLAFLDKIPGLTAIASILCPAVGVALAVANIAAAGLQGDWKGVALGIGSMVLGAKVAALTGKMGLMARAAVSGAVGGASGFGTALAYGASMKQALKAGAVGGASSVGTTYLSAAVQGWRARGAGGEGDGPAPTKGSEPVAKKLDNGTVYAVGSNNGTNPDKVWVHVMGSVGAGGAAASLEGALGAAAQISKETGLVVVVVPNANECGCSGWTAVKQGLGIDTGGAGGRGVVGDPKTVALLGDVITHYGKANIAGISAFSQGAAIVNSLSGADGAANGISKHYFNPAISESAAIADASKVTVYANSGDRVWQSGILMDQSGYTSAGATLVGYDGDTQHDQFGPISRLRR